MRRARRSTAKLLPALFGVVVLGTATIVPAADTDLAEAARRGDVEQVRSLLAGARSTIDTPSRDGMTALLWAVQADNIPLARELLEHGADANLANRLDITPLWLAALNRSPGMLGLLLEHDADATFTMPHGETALMAAARAGDAASIRLLLEAGADPNASEASMGETALMWAAAEDHAEAISALVAGGADPDAHSRVLELAPMEWVQIGMVSTVLPVGGWTALMHAARQDSQQAAIALAEGGADLDAQDGDGATALQIAIINEHYDLAALLLEAGADPDVADRTGMTSLYAAVDMANFGSDIGRPPRPRFDTLDAHDIVRLSLEHGASADAELSSAIIGRHHGFGDFALGAGSTPLMRAIKSGDTQSIALLAEAGADLGKTGRGGETLLQFAARQGSADSVRLLIERGADIDARNDAGQTALDLVSGSGRGRNEAMRALLLELGATPPAP